VLLTLVLSVNVAARLVINRTASHR
jgi:hypothetical protein